jgi:hypothetical protein
LAGIFEHNRPKTTANAGVCRLVLADSTLQPIQLLESSHASCCELSVAHLAMKPWPVLLFRLVGMNVSGVIAGAFE